MWQLFKFTNCLYFHFRLSERNCVEIVSKLIELKLIDVFYTNDGKEYVTPQQLSKEISDELYLHGGRISLTGINHIAKINLQNIIACSVCLYTDLVPILNIGLQAIESRAQDLVQSRPEIHLVAGQLIDDDYMDRCVEEINETLQQNGQITLGWLSNCLNFVHNNLFFIFVTT